jgi:hypothetical protein
MYNECLFAVCVLEPPVRSRDEPVVTSRKDVCMLEFFAEKPQSRDKPVVTS